VSYRVKQVILYRRDLKMRKGKIAAQVAHASMKVFFDRGHIGPSLRPVSVRSGSLVLYADEICSAGTCCRPPGHKGGHDQVDDGKPSSDAVALHEEDQFLTIPLTPDMEEWVEGTFAKVVLSVEGEKELGAAMEAAWSAGLPCALIEDLGFTEFKGVPTKTAVAIGPAKSALIDLITGPDGCIPTKLA